MPRSRSETLFIGIGSHVVAIDPNTGSELWRTKLKSSSFITLRHTGTRIFAGAAGELFCLDSASGQILWRNKLKSLGLGIIAFTSSEEMTSFAALRAQEAAAAAATSSANAG